MTTTLCRGCGRSFKSTGYLSHLTQSRNPSCKAIHTEYLTANFPDPNTPKPPEVNDDASPPPVPFTGDIFGSPAEYLEDDFGQVNEDGIQSEESDIEENEDQDRRRIDYELEMGWEPPRLDNHENPQQVVEAEDDDDEHRITFDSALRFLAERRIDECSAQITRYTSQHPNSRAGAVVSQGETSDDHYSDTLHSMGNPWAPFSSEIDWKVACWAKLRGPGSTAFSELLAINGVRNIQSLSGIPSYSLLKIREALNLSYKNTDELNKIIDTSLPRRPSFKRHEVVVAGESFELYARDIVECLKALWADPDFLPFLVFEPERHYADGDHSCRLFHDMHTGKWWWDTQVNIY